jgi:hypothetical protein
MLMPGPRRRRELVGTKAYCVRWLLQESDACLFTHVADNLGVSD